MVKIQRYNIVQNEKICFVCGSSQNIHIHEVYFGKNRKISIEDGCCVYLCGRHHNQSNEGVHFNHELDIKLKRVCENKWMDHYNKTEDDFRKRFGKSYL